jgi:prophage tail gpP-like protein
MGEVQLLVDGRRYGGWTSVRITQSVETIAGSFSLDVTDRWTEAGLPWPIREEDPCQVLLDGEVVIDGYVDRRHPSFDAQQRAVAITGRDRAAILVDSSAVLDRWSFRNASVLDVARKVCEPFGIGVTLQAGLTLPAPPRKMAVNPGDTAYAVIERAAAAAGVLVVSDGAGGIMITRAGTVRAAPLVEGGNLLAGELEYNAEERYGRYVVVTQSAGTDNASGGATRVRAEAVDEGVRRAERVLLVRPENGITTDYARQRADWEARVRAARAETARVSVQGWKQPNGARWPINALAAVRSPTLGVNGDLLIAQVDYSLSAAGEVTQLSLVRPDAYTPEPAAKVRKSKGERWKELG